jgi:predicted RNase H-like nuclease (RuvC/YqgF family)
MEATSANLSKEAQSLRAALSKNAVKQQAMTLQQSMSRLEADLSQTIADQQRLEDPRATTDQLQHAMQADWAQIEMLKNTVRELQETARQREAALAELGGHAAAKTRCDKNTLQI